MRIYSKIRLSSIAIVLSIAISAISLSCGDSGSGSKSKSDSVHSGMEGTRDDASQLSNATIDTSSGQNVKKASPARDGSKLDSLPVK